MLLALLQPVIVLQVDGLVLQLVRLGYRQQELAGLGGDGGRGLVEYRHRLVVRRGRAQPVTLGKLTGLPDRLDVVRPRQQDGLAIHRADLQVVVGFGVEGLGVQDGDGLVVSDDRRVDVAVLIMGLALGDQTPVFNFLLLGLDLDLHRGHAGPLLDGEIPPHVPAQDHQGIVKLALADEGLGLGHRLGVPLVVPPGPAEVLYLPADASDPLLVPAGPGEPIKFVLGLFQLSVRTGEVGLEHVKVAVAHPAASPRLGGQGQRLEGAVVVHDLPVLRQRRFVEALLVRDRPRRARVPVDALGLGVGDHRLDGQLAPLGRIDDRVGDQRHQQPRRQHAGIDELLLQRHR